MITLFKPNETDFSHNGIGNLDYHIINPVVEEELNGLYSFTFRYPLYAPHGLEIEGQSILRVPVPGLEDQLFRVYRPVKSMGYITVSCYHIFYDLADNFIEDTNIVEKNGQGAIEQLGGATQFGHRFRFFSNISTVANARLVRRNVVGSILDDEQGNSFINRWGGELIRNNFDVRMNQSAGTNAGFTVKHRKNLTGYEADVDFSTVVTRIMPQGFDGLFLPEKYIDSPLINNYETPKIQRIEYNEVKAAIGEYADDDDAIPLEEAYAELRRLAAEEYSIHNVDVPTVRYSVNFVTLDQTEAYKDLEDLQQLKIGDMVTVDHDEDNFSAIAKLVRYRYDPITKRYLAADLGSINEGITSRHTDINAINRRVDAIADRTLVIQSTADGKSSIYRGESEPSNPNLGDLWYKPNGAETEMYQFVDEGGQRFWKLIADTADVTSVKRDVDQALEDSALAKNNANTAVANASLATQNASEAITQAQSAFDDAQTALTTAQGLTSRMTTVEGDISTLTQTTQSFATRIENAEGDISTLTQTAQGLQNRVADAEGNISSVTQIATGLQSRMTNAEGSINTLTQTASSLQSTISSVRADLDNRLEKYSINMSATSDGIILLCRSDVNGPNNYIIGEFFGKRGSSGNNPGGKIDIVLTNSNTDNRMSGYIETSEIQMNQSWSLVTLSYMGEEYVALRKQGSQFTMWDGFMYFTGSASSSGELFKFINNETTSDISNIREFVSNRSVDTPMTRTQSQITQLSDNINLRVEKGDVINQINISTESVLIAGEKLILDGDTTVTGTFRVANANIISLNADKVTTGTLDAGQVNIINLNASNISAGTINGIDIIGSTLTSYNNSTNDVVSIENGRVESYRNGNLTVSIGQGNLNFYNAINEPVGRFIPTYVQSTNERGLALDVEQDFFDISILRQDYFRPVFRVNTVSNETTVSGPFNGAITGSTLRLFANQRIVSSNIEYEHNPNAYDQPSIYMRQGVDHNDMIQYFGGFNRRTGATWSVRYNDSQTTYQNRIIAHDSGVDLFGKVYVDGGVEIDDAVGIGEGLRLNSYQSAHVITSRSSSDAGLTIYPQRWARSDRFTIRSHSLFSNYVSDFRISNSGHTLINEDLKTQFLKLTHGTPGDDSSGDRFVMEYQGDGGNTIMFTNSASDGWTSRLSFEGRSRGTTHLWDRIRSDGTNDSTTTNSANMHIFESSSRMSRVTSSRRYKIDEQPVHADHYKLLNVIPKDWYDRSELEEYAEQLTLKHEGKAYSDVIDMTKIRRVPGLVAEDVHDAGLHAFVNYSSEGVIEGIMYDRLWTLLIPIVKDHDDELTILKKQNESLILKVAELESRLNKLEVA